MYEHQKGSTGWSITTIFISVYCLLHVLALVKSQNQEIKNVHKEDNIQSNRVILFQLPDISVLQNSSLIIQNKLKSRMYVKELLP